MNRITSNESVKLADEIAERTRKVERAFIAASWLDPVGGSNAGFYAGLCGTHFAFPEHAALYIYICRYAELWITPVLRQCVRAMRLSGLPLNQYDDIAERELYEWVMSSRRSDGTPVELAQDIIHLHRKRTQASRLLKRVGDVFAHDVIEGILQRCRTTNTQSSETSPTSNSSLSNGSGKTAYLRENSVLLPVRKVSVSRS